MPRFGTPQVAAAALIAAQRDGHQIPHALSCRARGFWVLVLQVEDRQAGAAKVLRARSRAWLS
jgi:hypothetical protein